MGTSDEFIKAIKGGNLENVSAMLDANPGLVSAADGDGSSAVLTACYYQHPDVAQRLIQRGAPLNIFEACAAGSLEKTFAILQESPGLLNEFAPDGFQPLGLAAFFGHSAVAKALLDAGAEPDIPSRNGLKVTPLNSAAAGGRIDIARMLLEKGANPNTPQSGDFVPLHAAAQNGQAEMVILLLAYGADKTLKSADGKSALQHALDSGHPELAELLA